MTASLMVDLNFGAIEDILKRRNFTTKLDARKYDATSDEELEEFLRECSNRIALNNRNSLVNPDGFHSTF